MPVMNYWNDKIQYSSVLLWLHLIVGTAVLYFIIVIIHNFS